LSINIEKIETFYPKKKILIKKLKFPLIKKIIQATGVNTVWKSSEKEDVIYLATKAAQKLINKKDIANIDVVFLVTQSPTYNIPSNSCIIHNKLGLKKNCMVFDINQGCSGYIYALNIAESILFNNNFSKALILTSDTYSKYSKKLNVSCLFSDAATATLVSKNNQKPLYNFTTYSDKHKCLQQKNTNILSGISSNSLIMSGTSVFNFSINEVTNEVEKFLKKNKIEKKKIKYFLFHQASKIVLDNLNRKLNISKNQTYNNIHKYGNTVSSTLPILIKDLKKKLIVKEDVLLCGFGVGLSIGICKIKI
jgi:3-oxoacyl-[acyl-carrier-protein] synthase-3